jgi:hypothetical protein
MIFYILLLFFCNFGVKSISALHLYFLLPLYILLNIMQFSQVLLAFFLRITCMFEILFFMLRYMCNLLLFCREEATKLLRLQ